MSKLKLGPLEGETPVKITLELPAAIHHVLVAEARAHAAESGDKAAEPARPSTQRHLAPPLAPG